MRFAPFVIRKHFCPKCTDSKLHEVCYEQADGMWYTIFICISCEHEDRLHGRYDK